MYIQPMDSTNSQIGFSAGKFPRRNVGFVIEKLFASKPARNGVYRMATGFSLASVAAYLTKRFIDFCNGKDKVTEPMPASTMPQGRSTANPTFMIIA